MTSERSFVEKRDLKELEDRIAGLEADVQALKSAVADLIQRVYEDDINKDHYDLYKVYGCSQ